MASIEAMIKEASRSLTIRVKRQAGAQKELTAAQDMDKRAVDRLAKAESAVTTLDAEVAEKAGIVARLTDRSVESVLEEIRAELDDENFSLASGDAPADESPDAVPVPKAKTVKTTKVIADSPQA